MTKGHSSSGGGRTGKAAASAAARILASPRSTKAEKQVAASDLAQRRK